MINIFWFRRDLRIEDNTALYHALAEGKPVLPIFIFDKNILSELPQNDARVSFIHSQLHKIDEALKKAGSSINVMKCTPLEAFEKLCNSYPVHAIYSNRDYEPYAIKRDKEIEEIALKNKAMFLQFKDQVIFEKQEILKSNGEPYAVYTPYKNQWLLKYANAQASLKVLQPNLANLIKGSVRFPFLNEIGFKQSEIQVSNYRLKVLDNYKINREIPSIDGTSLLGPHLRFGTVSVRQIINQLKKQDDVFLFELIWREFFMQILSNYPRVVNESFKSQYNGISWRNVPEEFEKWCNGTTGYPLVDAGMRQLNQTGYMHNRIRMVTASFLCKHLLIDWRWGEAYFAQKLLDYELASNNGNWQWAAGTGCDASPYFRVFSPALQQKKFDQQNSYIKNWVPEFGTPSYPKPMVDHQMARERAISAYKKALNK
jgi:deoxyribodipyrimidine photo-lyase